MSPVVMMPMVMIMVPRLRLSTVVMAHDWQSC